MPSYRIVLWIMAGVAISVILPVLRRGYPRVTAATSREFWRLLWDAAKPYLLLGIGSTLTAHSDHRRPGQCRHSNHDLASGAATRLFLRLHASEVEAGLKVPLPRQAVDGYLAP